jgi:penicillin-binding protein 1A
MYHFDKEKLFILYLHLIPFERGYGFANSAQYYYQKTISQLTVEEVVMLLGIARSPTIYSPFSHPEKAKEIQVRLMQKLRRCRYITTPH